MFALVLAMARQLCVCNRLRPPRLPASMCALMNAPLSDPPQFELFQEISTSIQAPMNTFKFWFTISKCLFMLSKVLPDKPDNVQSQLCANPITLVSFPITSSHPKQSNITTASSPIGHSQTSTIAKYNMHTIRSLKVALNFKEY